MKTVPVMTCCALFLLSSARGISEQCKIHGTNAISCHCIGDEEFSLPDWYNYENVTSLRIASCSFANLHFSSLTEASQIAEIVVQNISERLIFELFLTTTKMKRLRRIPLITHDTFVSLRSIETVRIEDTRIGDFKERFTDISINDFTMINVTIDRIDELNFSEKGETLRIRNTELQNVEGSLNFVYFSTVEMFRSNFRLKKPGYVLIEGDVVYMENCVFSNSSANVVATDSIKINGTCADGKSSLRLSSNNIVSTNNRLPTEIIYTRNRLESTEGLLSRNNTVCIAGNCNCEYPKSSGQMATGTFYNILFQSLLQISLVTIYF
ncbi:uncharacterized protein LOC108624735 [Ceratina calcarata]|uniref:Uncharacterized protein LOC108624735 n=1 Tax=Ceratina calcarata TaxID=156304 RepID=A0AAJ7IYQ8_9HYME|nr:uncharacterized protein LOC108624735 [Ceratina calcarata]